jgi:hypothetical protein
MHAAVGCKKGEVADGWGNCVPVTFSDPIVATNYTFLYTPTVPPTFIMADIFCPPGYHLATEQEVLGAINELCANVPTYYILRISGGTAQAFAADRAGEPGGCVLHKNALLDAPKPFNGYGGWLCSKRTTP